MKFTQQSLTTLTLPAGKTEHIEWDDALPGLGIRLRETKHGLTKSFRIQYRVGARQRAQQSLLVFVGHSCGCAQAAYPKSRFGGEVD